MTIYIALYQDGGALLEDAPNGDSNVELDLPPRAAAALEALLKLESFEVATALGAIWMHGCVQGERSARTRVSSPPHAPSDPALVVDGR